MWRIASLLTLITTIGPGCSLSSPGARVSLLVLIPFALIVGLLWLLSARKGRNNGQDGE